jgi:NitT/TauT family transport system substrate-binding protein
MRKVRVAPKGMGLNDFVAEQEGFFADEGIEVEWDIKTFRGTQSSWKDLDYKSRPQDKPYAEGDKSLIQCACVWGSISNASAGMGRFVPDCYGVSPWAIFVRLDSKIKKPQDLRDVPVSVGMRAGSHFNVPFRLEKYLPLENIKVVNTGGFGARLKALLEGEVEAASLLPPQIDMARQLGLRMVMEDEFHTLWWVPDTADKDDVRGYLRGLDRAETSLNLNLQQYLPLWEKCIPPEFKGVHKWDYSRFTRGERFVFKPIPRTEFDETLAQVKRWKLDQYLNEQSFDKLTYQV